MGKGTTRGRGCLHLDIAPFTQRRAAPERQLLAHRGNKRLCAAVARLGLAVHVCANRDICCLPAQGKSVSSTPSTALQAGGGSCCGQGSPASSARSLIPLHYWLSEANINLTPTQYAACP